MRAPVTIQTSKLIKATPFFYGWIILFSGTLGIIMIGPSQTFTVSIFIDHFIGELGIPRSNLALLYGVATLGASFMLPITGRLFDRFGGRRMVIVTALGLGVACIAMSRVTGVLTVLMAMLALRYLGFGSLQLVSSNVIAQWFIRRRGFVMGLAGLSLAAGLLIFPPLTESLIDQFSWRGAWVGLGLLVWAVMLPLGWLFFRDRPEAYGLLPDGKATGSLFDQATAAISEENWTLPEARQTGAFWLFLFALSTITLLVGGLVFHQLSLFEVRGLSRDLAVKTFQFSALFTIVGNLAMGRMMDRFSARRLLALTLLLLISALILVQVMATPQQALIYGALLGLVSGAFRVIDSVIWAKYFGRLHLGKIRGVTMIGSVGGTALGAYPLGLSLDYFNSYSPALIPLSILAVGICFSTVFINRPVRKQAHILP